MYENEEQRLTRLYQDVAKISLEMKRLEPAFTEAQMILSQPPKIREIILRARGDAFDQWMEKRKAKQELAQLKSPFILPPDQEYFSPEDIRFWALKNGLGKGERNLRKHLRKLIDKLDFGADETVAVEREEVERFFYSLEMKSRGPKKI